MHIRATWPIIRQASASSSQWKWYIAYMRVRNVQKENKSSFRLILQLLPRKQAKNRFGKKLTTRTKKGMLFTSIASVCSILSAISLTLSNRLFPRSLCPLFSVMEAEARINLRTQESRSRISSSCPSKGSVVRAYIDTLHSTGSTYWNLYDSILDLHHNYTSFSHGR